ncbi:MAG: choice-of-anchor L domain-containing protein [Lewinellaceae bacterium]|nr:choice-of-anchor L domain-containing protein [Lewinellaceae bacterium]
MRLCFTLVCTLFAYHLAAQQTLQVDMKGAVMRQPLDAGSEQLIIQLCELIPGNTYTVIALGANQGQSAAFEITSSDNSLEQVITAKEKPGFIRFKATGACATIDVKVNAAQYPTPMYLSVRCEECPSDNAWKEQFLEKVGSIANLATVGGISASSLVNNTLIGGDCFDVANITSSGNAASRGTFSNGATNIGLSTGVVLCTGNVNVLPGPNNIQNANGGFGNNSADDPDLASLTNGNQYDVSRIEFDFTPTTDMVTFEFVFGSEEYCEFVGSQFNDVFGFFISGPGISGTQNIALIPGGAVPVSINNVNHQDNTAYYVNNNNGNSCNGLGAANIPECQLDGWTVVLTAEAAVQSCGTYHIKLAIADVGDANYASAVFLKANSFDAGGQAHAEPVYPSGLQYVYEGCGQGFIKFTRGGDLSQPLEVHFTVAGTATPGDDYAPLSSPVIIPAGQSMLQIPITVYQDLIIEGQESIVLLLENPCSCNQQEVEFFIEDLAPLEVEMEDQTLCGNGGVTLSPGVTGGQNPLTYLWSNGLSSPTINVNTPGTNSYTVTVTDNCGSTGTATANVTIQPAPTATLSGSGFFCEGTPGTVNLNVALTGTGPWEVEYNANGSTETVTFVTSPGVITVTEPGNYSLVSVVSESGCTGTVSGNITIQEISVAVSLTPNDPTCFGSTNGSVLASGSGGATPYTYVWEGGFSGPNYNNLGPGTYTVTVTSNQGCTAVESVTLTEPPLLEIEVVASENIDCYNPTGSADLEVIGGTPGYTYTWSNNSNQEDPVFSAGGTFTVTVTDSEGCTKTTSVVITANTTLPAAVIVPPAQINCNVVEITLDGSGSSQGPNFSFEWSGPGFVCCDNTLQPVVNQSGVYSITVTNTDNGCTKTVSVNVVENNTPPNAVANAPFNIGCNHPTVTISGAGSSSGPGIVYQWTTADGNIVSGGTTLNPVVNQAGTYTLLVTNTNTGCTAEESVTITGNTILPVAAILPPGLVDCYNPELVIDANGSSQGPEFTYQWTTSNGVISGGANTLDPTITNGGTYTLVVTNTETNCTATATITVPANLTPPNAVANVNGGIDCQNATVTLNGAGSTVGGNITYEWTSFDGNILSGANTLNPVVNQGGTYTLVVTNTTNGCTDEASVTVSQDQDVPFADAGPDIELNCYDPTQQLQGDASVGPGLTFQWSASPGNFVSGQNSLSPTINQPGTYTILVVNNLTGCSSSDVVEVTSNFAAPDAQIAPPAVLNCNFTEIELDGSNSTMGPEMEYLWTTLNGYIVNGASTLNPTVNDPGTYTLLVTNVESGCTDQAQVTVTQNITPPAVNAGNGIEIDCQHPTVTLSGSGSSGPNYFVYWETFDGNIISGEFTFAPVVSQGGTYTLVITNNANGCTASDDVVVTVDQDFPNADAGPDMEINCADPVVTIDGTFSSTGQGYLYQWVAAPGNIVSGANTLTPNVNQEGLYILTLTNTNNGCTATDEVWVSNNVAYPTAVIAPPDQLNCIFTSIQLDASGSSPGSISYEWYTPNGNILNGAFTANPEIDEPGVYTVTVTDGNNFCTATAQISVTQNIIQPAAVASAPGQLSCQFPQVQLSGQGSSLGNQFFYYWSTQDGNIVNGAFTLSPTVDQPGTYSLLVQNYDTGCESTADVVVQTSQAFPVADAGPAQNLTCSVNQLVLDGSGSSQGPAYTFSWSTANGNILSGSNSPTPAVNAPGTYNLTVVNTQNGCSASTSVIVGTDYSAPQAVVAPGGVLSCSVTSLALDGSGSSTGNNYAYNWTTLNGNILSGSNTLSPVVNGVGAYTLLVVNSTNGCTASATTSVAADASLPAAVAGLPDTLTCNIQQLTLNGTASSQGNQYAYQWNGPGIVAGASTLQPAVNLAGLYELVVTNTTNGCTALSAVNIAADQVSPLAEAGAGAELNCVVASLTLGGMPSSSGPLFTYGWTTTGGNILSGGNTLNPVIDQPGLYSLVITNTYSGCTATDAVNITQDIAIPAAGAGTPDTITCSSPVIVLDGSGSIGSQFTYSWTTPDGNIASGDSTLMPVVDAPGLYNLLVINNQNGCTASSSVLVDIDANVPTALATVSGELNCIVTQLQLSGVNSTQGPDISYTWSSSNGNIVSGANTLSPLVNAPGDYTLNLFNASNNCTATSTVTVNLNLIPPVADAGMPVVLTCYDPVLGLDANGSSSGNQFVYLWNTANGHIVSGSNSLTPQIDQPGQYNLVVTDQSNGCTAIAAVAVQADQNAPVAEAGASPVLTCAILSLPLNGSSSSQGGQFVYAWTTTNGQIVSGATTLAPTVAAPGDYDLTVVDTQNGCTATDQVTVNQDIMPPVANAGVSPTLTCTVLSTQLNGAGSSTGSQYQYLWSTANGQIIGGANTLAPNVGTPGLYVLLVTNQNNGCTQSAAVQVLQDIMPPSAFAAVSGEPYLCSTDIAVERYRQ